MKSKIVWNITGTVFGLGLLLSGHAWSQQASGDAPQTQNEAAAASTVTEAEKERIGSIVREYLLANPEILEEVQIVLQEKREAQKRIAQRETIANAQSRIFTTSGDPVIGNPEAKVAVVEFFDYNCGYCKRALDDMNAMVAADPELKFILKDFPILGPDSQKAHIVASAFNNLMPEKYRDYHIALLGGPGRADEGRAIQLAIEMGADEEKLRAEMENPAIASGFGETYELANMLGITGTPSYVVGDEVVFGALGQRVLTQKVANVRKCESATC